MSIIHVFDMIFIIIFLMRILLKKEKLYEFPYIKIFAIYLSVLLFISVHIYLVSGIIVASDFFFKSLFMPMSFYLCYVYFKDRKSVKLLVGSLILSGIFPLVFTFIQRFTGHVWFFHQSRGLVRSVGLYHDAVTPRSLFIQMLIGIFIYWHYFLRKDQKLLTALLVILLLSSLLGLYFLYSKTIIITLTLWIVLFIFLRGKIYVLPFAILLVFFVNYFTNSQPLNEYKIVFSREAEFLRGDLQVEYALSGRGRIWKSHLSAWPVLPLLQKIIGAGISYESFHNDFIGILFSGGVLLLFSNLMLTLTIYARVVRGFQKHKEFINFVALLSIIYFVIESLGQVPGLYPGIQIFTWGVIGLALNRKLEQVGDSNYKK